MKNTEQATQNGTNTVPRKRRFLRVMALFLCVGALAFALVAQSLPVQIDDNWPPLNSWDGTAPITLEQTQLTVPLGTTLTQENILRDCGAEAHIEGQFVVSGLDTISTEKAGQYVVQITLQDADHIALGSVFLTLRVMNH